MRDWLTTWLKNVISFLRGDWVAQAGAPQTADGNRPHRASGGRHHRKSTITSQDLRRVVVVFYWSIAIGMAAVIVHAWGTATVAVLWALGSLASGAAVGFLFGIPRILQGAKPATPRENDVNASYRQMVNTNLEQISDWLTKIIVGLGLVQMGNIPGYVESMAHELASCTGGACGKPFAEGILVYFSVMGFLVGYLLTRLFLAGAFSRADQEASAKIERLSREREGEAASARMKADFASALAAEAPPPQGDPAAQLTTLVDEYNTIRREQRSGDARTAAMTGVVTRIIRLSPSLTQNFDVAQALRERDNRGRRLAAYAFLYAHPDPAHLTPLVDSLTGIEDTPFGQYWAIQAIGKILGTMDRASVDRAVLERLRQFLRTRLRRGTDRYADLSRILQSQSDTRG